MAETTATPQPHPAAAPDAAPDAAPHAHAQPHAAPAAHPEHGAHTPHPSTAEPTAHHAQAAPHAVHAEHGTHPVAAEAITHRPTHAANDAPNHHAAHTAHPPAANDAQMHTSPHLAIIGGGITGLTAAWEALKKGEKNIVVYEAEQRLGGKIQSGWIGNTVVNRGAEFIDSEEVHLIALARELGVNLTENNCRVSEEFQRPDGSIMTSEKFYEAYKPYAAQVMRDREEAERNPNGARAQFLETLSLKQYAQLLEQTVQVPNRSLWRFLVDTFTFHGNEAKLALQMATQNFASECGQPIRNLSTKQFLAETSPTLDEYLACDEHYRVEGGTEQLITKLKEKLESQGVKFVTGAKLTSVSKGAHGGADLHFENHALNSHAKQFFLAGPGYMFKNIQGLDAFGLTPEMQSAIANLQYTNSFKVTVGLKPGAKTSGGAFYSPNGFQCWSPAPGLLTLLSMSDELSTKSPKQLITERLDSYAKAHGSTVDEMFDLSKINYANPGEKACYASPKPGQVKALEAVQSHLPEMAKHGMGIAGTYMPLEGCVGFMECGVSSAKEAIAHMIGHEHAHAQQKQWAQHVEQQRVAANDPNLQIAANSR